MCDWRARTFWEKEPETLEWIKSFKPGAVFFDVGANIGLYSIYAAARGGRVWAFEPSALNYNLLVQNSALNYNTIYSRGDLNALPIAISDDEKITPLFFSSALPGAAMSSIDPRDVPGFKFSQAALTYSLDEFSDRFRMPNPDHIKIDIDGRDVDVLMGAEECLCAADSVQIEMVDGSSEMKTAIDFLERSCCLTLFSKRQSEMIKNSKYRDVFNFLFIRK